MTPNYICGEGQNWTLCWITLGKQKYITWIFFMVIRWFCVHRLMGMEMNYQQLLLQRSAVENSSPSKESWWEWRVWWSLNLKVLRSSASVHQRWWVGCFPRKDWPTKTSLEVINCFSLPFSVLVYLKFKHYRDVQTDGSFTGPSSRQCWGWTSFQLPKPYQKQVETVAGHWSTG